MARPGGISVSGVISLWHSDYIRLNKGFGKKLKAL